KAYKLAFLPPRPHRLPPLRAFHLSASRRISGYAVIKTKHAFLYENIFFNYFIALY
ncbi:MAG TPA: hypothetical protein GXZ40_09190, partial [Bacteroidales bacterium]|nr:hypothetical protein [Bacteroidales bacterium]